MQLTTDRPRWLLPVAVAGVVLLGVLLWLFQPWLVFVDDVASEQLAVSVATEPTEATVADPAPDAQPMAEEEPMAVQDPMDGDEMVADPMDGGSVVDASAPATPEATPEPQPRPEAEPEAAPAPTGPVVLSQGQFIGRDHETTGTASIVQLEDGSRVLQLENFRTSNGPDLYVYLDDDPADAEALAFDDGLDLGELRANVGDLVYEIPDDADLDLLDSVVIWCDRFSHVFGAADLTPA